MNVYMKPDEPFFNHFFTWTVGHETLFEDMLEMRLRPPPSYPPHNLIEEGNGEYTIELSAAGFNKEELEVKTENSKLTITGKRAEETRVSKAALNDDEKVVHQGIAKRSFSKSFALAEDVVVDNVSLKDGMLTINLQKVIPEDKKEKIYSL